MSNIDIAKRLADIAKGTYEKIDKLEDLTTWEVREYFTDLGYLPSVIVDILGYCPTEHSDKIVSDYLRGVYNFEEMIIILDEYQAEVMQNE